MVTTQPLKMTQHMKITQPFSTSRRLQLVIKQQLHTIVLRIYTVMCPRFRPRFDLVLRRGAQARDGTQT